MNSQRLALLLGCVASAFLAYALLDFWSLRNGPLYKKFERQWAADVNALEESGKLPAVWNEIKDINVIGGTPETKDWLRRIEVPLHINPRGKHKMEVLVVAWEENGKHGVLVQYNIEDGKTKNSLYELGRTLILPKASKDDSLMGLFKDLSP